MKFLVCRLVNTILLLLVLAACSVREDVDECMQYALTVKAVDPDGNDLTGSGIVTSVDIYLFDEQGFVRRVPAGSSSDYLFAHNRASTLTLVAWGNAKADSLQIDELPVGTPIEQAQLSLLKSEDGYDQPITDLFYSWQVMKPISVSPATRGLTNEERVTLVLERRAAGMSIRTHHLNSRPSAQGKSCYFVVRGTSSALNFLGQPTDSKAGYVPPSVMDAQGDLYAAPFRIFPTQERRQRTEIDIVQGDEVLCTVAADAQGEPLYALPGQQLNVDIDLSSAMVQVTVTVVPWGEVRQDEEL